MDCVHVLDANITDALRTMVQGIVGGVVETIKLIRNAECALVQLAVEGGHSQPFADQLDHLTEVLAGQPTELLWHAIRVDVLEYTGHLSLFRFPAEVTECVTPENAIFSVSVGHGHKVFRDYDWVGEWKGEMDR